MTLFSHKSSINRSRPIFHVPIRCALFYTSSFSGAVLSRDVKKKNKLIAEKRASAMRSGEEPSRVNWWPCRGCAVYPIVFAVKHSSMAQLEWPNQFVLMYHGIICLYNRANYERFAFATSNGQADLACIPRLALLYRSLSSHLRACYPAIQSVWRHCLRWCV